MYLKVTIVDSQINACRKVAKVYSSFKRPRKRDTLLYAFHKSNKGGFNKKRLKYLTPRDVWRENQTYFVTEHVGGPCVNKVM